MGLYTVTVTGDYPYDDLVDLMPVRNLLKVLLSEHGYVVNKLALRTVRIQTELAKLFYPAHFFIYPDKVTQKDGQHYAAAANIAVSMLDTKSEKPCFFTISIEPALSAGAPAPEHNAKPLYYGITKELDVIAANVLLALRGELDEQELAALNCSRGRESDVLRSIKSSIDACYLDLLEGKQEWSQDLERLIARLLLHICPIETLLKVGNLPPLSIAGKWFSNYPLNGEHGTACHRAAALLDGIYIIEKD